MKKINFNVIFDLDGTLVHSVPDMHHAINKTLTKYSLKNISEEKLQTFVGQGMLSSSKKVVDFCGGDKGLYEVIFNSYRQNYSEQPYQSTFKDLSSKMRMSLQGSFLIKLRQRSLNA